MIKDPLEPEREFRRKEDEDAITNLNRFLKPYGLEASLNDLRNEEGQLRISDVLERLPRELEDGSTNGARQELSEFYQAFPPDQRSKGITITPKKLLSVLMDRTEFFSGLGQGLTRMCAGVDCEHYEVCPYKDWVADNRIDDQIECMVDRDVIRGLVRDFIYPEEGPQKVDPRRPAQAEMFEQFVQLKVKQNWLKMSMQKENVLAEHHEILQDGPDSEHFESANQVEHPLMKAWARTHKRIEKVMKAMGVTPEFEIRQGLWEDKDERINAERRAKELYLEKMSDTLRQIRREKNEKELEEETTYEELLEETIERMPDDPEDLEE